VQDGQNGPEVWCLQCASFTGPAWVFCLLASMPAVVPLAASEEIRPGPTSIFAGATTGTGSARAAAHQPRLDAVRLDSKYFNASFGLAAARASNPIHVLGHFDCALTVFGIWLLAVGQCRMRRWFNAAALRIYQPPSSWTTTNFKVWTLFEAGRRPAGGRASFGSRCIQLCSPTHLELAWNHCAAPRC